MMETEDRIQELLKQVYDPELGVNIVDLGLVYNIQYHPGKVYVKMTLTTPGCPMHDTIVGGVERILKDHMKIDEVEVKIVWDPLWSPDKMSEEAKEILGYF